MNNSDAVALVATLKAAYPHSQITDETVQIYTHDLEDLDVNVAEVAVAQARKTCRFLPTIAEIRERAAELQLNAPQPETAFAQALGAADQRHELVRQARRLVGDDWHWRQTKTYLLRDAFLAAYREVRAAAVIEVTAPAELAAQHGARELTAAP